MATTSLSSTDSPNLPNKLTNVIYPHHDYLNSPYAFQSHNSVTASLYNLLTLQSHQQASSNSMSFSNDTFNSNFGLNPIISTSLAQPTFINQKEPIFLPTCNRLDVSNIIETTVLINGDSDTSEGYSSSTSRRSSFSQKKTIIRGQQKEDSPLTESETEKKNDEKLGKREMVLRDGAYWERRKRNNDSAKRSRDSRKKKEDEISLKATLLEQENMKLRLELESIKNEVKQTKLLLITNSQQILPLNLSICGGS